MTADTLAHEKTQSFEADVARLLHLMVHSVYSDKDVFLRELVSQRRRRLREAALRGDSRTRRFSAMPASRSSP